MWRNKKRKKILVISIIILTVAFLSFIFILENIGIVYREKSSDNSIIIIVKSPDGSLPDLEGDKYNLLVYKNTFFRKKILDERFLFSDDLASFTEGNISIEWSDKSVKITIHGDEMNDKVYTCNWE